MWDAFVCCILSHGEKGSVLGIDGQESTTEDETFEDTYIPVLHSVPLTADFLIGMATVEYYQSFRHITDGSIYIQELCKQLEIGCPQKKDMHSILTRVNREVSFQTIRRSKQMPEVRYTLTKTLVLPMKQMYLGKKNIHI
ncbi:hypothetical protein PO909_006124 [Leuciscus waleckii]